MKKILVAASMVLFGFSGAYAAGTASGTTVKNSVSLSYTVGTISQTAIPQDDGAGFVVDTKIDFTVTNDDTAQIPVNPGATAQVTQWTVSNTSNAATYFTLASSNLAAGKTVYSKADTADTGTQTVFVSTDGGSTYNAYSGAISIAADANIKVQVKSDIPLTVVNADIMNIQLLATATDSGGTALVATAGADTIGTVDIVLADGTGDAGFEGTAYDGKYQAWGGYEVTSAAIALTKGSCVIWDPVNTTTNPKRIPGAVVRYTLQVANTGSQDATGVSASDALDAALAYGTTSPAPAAVALIATETCNCASPGTSNTDTVSAASNVVTANYGTVVKSTTECAYFDVTIN